MFFERFLYLILFVGWCGVSCAVDLRYNCTAEFRNNVLNGDVDNNIVKKHLAIHKHVCAALEKREQVRGFLSEGDRIKGCECVCPFTAGMACNDYSDPNKPAPVTWQQTIFDWVKAEEFEVTDDVKDTWIAIAKRLWPLALAFIPVLLQQYRYYNWPLATLLMAIYGAICMFFSISWTQTIYLYVTIGGCMVSTSSYGVVPEVVGGTFALLFFIVVSFVSDLIFQLLIAVLICAIYFAWIVQSFMVRRSGAIPGILIMVCLMMVMFEQIELIRRQYHIRTFSLDVFEMILGTVVPNGDKWFYCKNAAIKAYAGAISLSDNDWAAKHTMALTGAFALAQILFCLMFRAFLGMFAILVMRYKWSPENFSKGMVVYMSDIFGGWYIMSVIFCIHKSDSRRVIWSFVCLFLIWFEFWHGIDIIILRVLFWIGDTFIFQTGFSNAPKYLSCDMDLADFPQYGACNWIPNDLITEFSKHTVYLTGESNKDGKDYFGLGFIKKVSKRCLLLSVKHVVDDFSFIEFRGERIDDPVPKVLGMQNEDPVACLSLPSNIEGANVEMLRLSEVGNVTELYFIKRHENGNGRTFSCRVNKFRFDNDGNIHCAISLSRGNSGGPAFAVLNNGEVRYAGCVAGGDDDIFAGNWISSVCSQACYGQGKLSAESSSDESSHASPVRGRRHSFSHAMKKSDVVSRISVLNRAAQSFRDKMVGLWFVDELEDGNEARYFEDMDELRDYIEARQNYIDMIKEDSDPRKKKWRVYRKEINEKLSSIHSQACKLVGEKNADRFVWDLRCGALPKVSCNSDIVSVTFSSDAALAGKHVRWE